MNARGPKLVYRALDVAGRAMPHDDAAEQELIGAGFASAAAIDLVLDVVRPEHMYQATHRLVWGAMVALRTANKPVDLVTVVNLLRERDELQAVGGITGVSALSTGRVGADAELVVEFARQVRGLARRRRVLEALQVQVGEGYSGRSDSDTFVEGVERAVFDATRDDSLAEGVDLAAMCAEEERRIEDIAKGRVSSGGVPFGLVDLDAKLGGGAEGETTILAGRPGMGKSSLLSNIAVNVAASNHDGIERGVLVFSLEMTGKKFFHRMVASEANVNLKRLIAGRLHGVEAERAWRARAFLSRLPLVIDDAAGLTPSRLRSRVRRAIMRFNDDRRRIALVAIDALPWMRSDRQYGTSTGDRAREVGDILKDVVELGKETGVHMLVAHQLNRDVGKRTGKDLRPRLTDLAESGEVEKHAHNIVFAHRPEYYHADKDQVPDDMRGLAELIIGKQRDGATGLVQVQWVDQCTRFQDRGATFVQRI